VLYQLAYRYRAAYSEAEAALAKAESHANEVHKVARIKASGPSTETEVISHQPIPVVVVTQVITEMWVTDFLQAEVQKSSTIEAAQQRAAMEMDVAIRYHQNAEREADERRQYELQQADAEEASEPIC
jgi:c-di-AMP phosphodiesterase-like protein